MARSHRAAKQQQKVQHAIINDASRSPQDRQQAKRLRQEAESQLELLTEAENIIQSDFYSYRYFASEGFLPGYSFPRLPLSAYIPARRIKSQNDEFLSRPRFLAISEFGPRSIIYHEGSRYIINKVNLPVSESGMGLRSPVTRPGLRYLHPITTGDGLTAVSAADRCWKLRSTTCSGCKTSPPSGAIASLPMRKSACGRGMSFVRPSGLPTTPGSSPPGRQKFVPRMS
jgi:hypothetical protein